MVVNGTEFLLKTPFLLRETKSDNGFFWFQSGKLEQEQEDVSRLTSCFCALPLCMHVHVAPALVDP